MKSSIFKKKLYEINKNNVVIIGHMGSGKSIIGKMLAKNFQVEHFDSDQEIVKITKKSINEIFEQDGERHFRTIEEKTSIKLIKRKNIIISLGGGAILNKLIRENLKKKSFTIFLDVDLKTLATRLKNSTNRPLLKNVDIISKVKELDRLRRKYYLTSSNVKIHNKDTASKTSRDIVNKFSSYYEEGTLS